MLICRIFKSYIIFSVSITEESSLWVGAWWLGFLVGGCVVIAMSFPILLLPKVLPGTAHLRVGREDEMHQSNSASTSKSDDRQFFGFK